MITVTFFVIGLLVLSYGIFGWIPDNPFYWETISSELDDYFGLHDYHSHTMKERIIDTTWRISWCISGASMLILCFFYDSVLIMLSPILIPMIVGIVGYLVYYTCKVIGIVLLIIIFILSYIICIVFDRLIENND